jgi:ribosomal protein L1
MADYLVEIVNPKTSDEQIVTVSVTELQLARAKRSPDWMAAIQDLARPLIPKGYMPIGRRVAAL